MKTKKDFWKTVLVAYLLIFLGIIILLITDENNPFEIYFLYLAINSNYLLVAITKFKKC